MPHRLPPALHDMLVAQHGVVTRAQLLELGVSDRVLGRLLGGRSLVRLHPGVYTERGRFQAANGVARHCMRLLAVQLRVPDAAGCGLSAALVWGPPVWRPPVELTVLRPGNRSRTANARTRRSGLMAQQVTRHAGLVVTDLAKTVVDVAAEAAFADALITVDAALRRGVPLTELISVCSSAPPVKGVAAARRALAAGDPYAESWLESLSRGRMVERGLPLPLCNVVLRTRDRWVRPDFLLAEQGVIGEADGVGKYERDEQPAQVVLRERSRHTWLEDLGFEVARWGTPEVAGDGAVMQHRIGRAVGRQSARGFSWPADVQIDVPLLGAVPPPERVVREVHRLAALGLPITFTDARNQPMTFSLATDPAR